LIKTVDDVRGYYVTEIVLSAVAVETDLDEGTGAGVFVFRNVLFQEQIFGIYFKVFN